MEQMLTLGEIKSQFDSEWVLVSDPETNERLEIERGVVLAHSPNRDDVYRYAANVRPRRFAIVYTGVAPANTAIVL